MDKNNIHPGSDVSSGTFQCKRHTKRTISMGSSKSIPPCPDCVKEGKKTEWINLTGRGDAKNDPYPKK